VTRQSAAIQRQVAAVNDQLRAAGQAPLNY